MSLRASLAAVTVSAVALTSIPLVALPAQAATITWQTVASGDGLTTTTVSSATTSDGVTVVGRVRDGNFFVGQVPLGGSSATWATAATGNAAVSSSTNLSVADDGRVLAAFQNASGSVRTVVSNPARTTWSAQAVIASGGYTAGTATIGTAYNSVNDQFYAAWKTAAGGIKAATSVDGTNWTNLADIAPASSGANTGGRGPNFAVSPIDGRMIIAWPRANGSVGSASALPGEQFIAIGDVVASGLQTSTAAQVASMPNGDTVAAWRNAAGLSVSTAILPVGATTWQPLSTVDEMAGQPYSPAVGMNTTSGYMTITARNSANQLPVYSLRPGETTWTSMGLAATANANGAQTISTNPVDGTTFVAWFNTSNQVKLSRSLTPPGPPSPATTPTLTTRSDTTETIAWTQAQSGGSPVTAYEVERAANPDGPWTPDPAGCSGLGVVLTCTATGLTPATDYYYRVRATNSVGDGDYSNIGGPFRTLGAPAATTVAQTDLTATSAQLNATVRPNGVSTTAALTYAQTSDLTGPTVVTTPVTLTPNDSDAAQNVDVDVTGLQPATQYYYRVTASNEYQSNVEGSTLSFVTPAGPPLAITGSASSVAATTATINGTVNAQGSDAEVSFTVSQSPTLASGNGTFAASQTPVTGLAGTPVSRALTGLQPSTTYYYRVSATNGAGGPVVGDIESFTTNVGTPTVTTNPATDITATSATLNGVANPDGATGTIEFWYVSTFDSEIQIVAGNPAAAVAVPTTSSYQMTGLRPGTYYQFAMVLVIGENEILLNVEDFTTSAAAPTVDTAPPTNVAGNTATFNGSVNPNGQAAASLFEYGTSPTLTGSLTRVGAAQSPVDGNVEANISANVSGLLPGTTYYYRALANNGIGGEVVADSIQQFTTDTVAAQVAISAANNVTPTTATLRGIANPGGATDCIVEFQYSTSEEMVDALTVPAAQSPLSGPTNVAITADVNELTPGETYYYLAQISCDGEPFTVSEVQELSVPAVAPTAVTGAANNVTGVSATLDGSVNPGGADSVVTFEYGTDPTLAAGTTPVAANESPMVGVGSQQATVAIGGLAKGTTYYYRVVADNGVGSAVVGATEEFTTLDDPGVPLNPAVGVGNAQASITWEAPVSDGGSPITGYTVTASDGRTCSVLAPFDEVLGCRISGLPNGVPVTFTITATNAVGTGPAASAGAAVTPSGAPTATTLPASAVGATSASLNGTFVANGASTTASFKYGTDPTLATGTTTVVSSGTTSTSPVAINLSASGLAPATTYYFRALAGNENDSSAGAILSFTTSISPPAATTNPATDVTSTTATLNGHVVANGAATTATFHLSTSANMSGAVLVGTATNLSASANQAVFTGVTGLLPGTQYYFQARAVNGAGEPVNGATQSFTTTALTPTATTTAATNIGGTSATLNGTVNPMGASTTVSFTYGQNPSLTSGTTTVTVPSAITGTSAVNVSRAISGLSLATTYYYRISAANAVGPVDSDIIASFTTPGLPGAPQAVTASPAGTQLVVGWNPPASDGGRSVTGYIVTAGPGGQTCSTAAVAPATPSTTCVITGLTNGTPYTVSVVAITSVGTGPAGTAGPVTPADMPTPTTAPATAVSSGSVTFNGSMVANGATATTSFEHSQNANMSASSTVAGTPSTVANTGTFAASIATAPGTTYYFRACGVNSAGSACGTVLSVTTPAALPTVSTVAADTVTADSAVIRGSVTANGLTTTPTFSFSTDSAIPAGSPSIGGSPTTVTGSTPTAVAQTLTGLQPATTYYYRARATNGLGAAAPGQIMSFTTEAAPPTATTGVASSVLGTTATVEGEVNAGGATTDVSFEYGTDPNLAGSTSAPADPAQVNGNDDSIVSLDLASLAPGTTYYYRVVADNDASVSPITGDIESFVTQDVPGAPQNVNAEPRDGSVVVTWEAPASDGGSPVTSYTVTASPGGASCTVVSPFPDPLSCTLEGLDNGTEYTVAVNAENAVGPGAAAESAAVTPAGGPVVNTENPSGVTTTAATLNGGVNANGADTDVSFEYGTSSTLAGATTVVAAPATVTGAVDTPVAANVTGLLPGTVYYYRAIGVSDVGETAAGDIVAFTTDPVAPVATTNTASSVATTSATLNGSVMPGGDPTTVNFVLWPASNPAATVQMVADQSPVDGLVSVPVSVNASSLTPGTQYFYRVQATNSAGSSVGAPVSFFTPGPPSVTTTAATSVLGTSARLNGSVVANSATTAVTFAYGTSPALSGATIVPGSPASANGTASMNVSFNATGLAPGTTYYFRAQASNANSGGVVNGTTMQFTTQGPPSAPLNVVATGGVGQATVTWDAPSSNGGSPVTGYTVTAGPGGASCTVTAPFPNPLSCTIPGLTNGTAYSFTVVAANAIGTGPAAAGAATPAGPPVAVTGAATTSGVTAALSGSVNANGSSTATTFTYGTDPSLSTGTTTVTGTPSPVTGTSATTVTADISGLAAGQTYYYRVGAANSVRTVAGSIASFTVLASAPTVTTGDATPISSTTVRIDGSARAGGATTDVNIRVATSSDMTTLIATVPADESPITGDAVEAVAGDVGGLAQLTTYYYQVVASNTVAAVAGEVRSFTTPGPPTAQTDTPASIGTTTAELPGTVGPGGQDTQVTVILGTVPALDSGTEVAIDPTPDTVNGTNAAQVVGAATGLLPDTTYYYRVTAGNESGSAEGEIRSFTTLLDPTATTDAATAVTADSASLNGTVNAGGGSVDVEFEYSLNANLSSSTTVVGSPASVSGGSDTAVSADLSGLAAGTQYYFRVNVEGDHGSAAGSIMSFTTALDPTAVTDAASAVTADSASLNGTVNAGGGSVDVEFEYSLNANLSSSTTVVGAPASVSGGSDTAVSADLSGLAAGTQYYFRVNVAGDHGSAAGSIMSFTTALDPTAVTDPATVSGTSATLRGTVNPGGAPADVSFRYSKNADLSAATNVNASQSPVSGSTDTSVTATLSALSPGRYYYQVRLSRSGELVVGDIESFTVAGPAVAVDLRFVDVPMQVALKTPTRISMLVTARQNRTVSALAAPNGNARLSINGAYKCTAKIVNGKGSCMATITKAGALVLSAQFRGTVAGISGQATANATARATASVVAIQKAVLRNNGCVITANIRGQAAQPSLPITVYIYVPSQKRWQPVAYAMTNATRAWAAKFTTASMKMKLMAKSSIGASAPVTITYQKHRSADSPPTFRGC